MLIKETQTKRHTAFVWHIPLHDFLYLVSIVVDYLTIQFDIGALVCLGSIFELKIVLGIFICYVHSSQVVVVRILPCCWHLDILSLLDGAEGLREANFQTELFPNLSVEEFLALRLARLFLCLRAEIAFFDFLYRK